MGGTGADRGGGGKGRGVWRVAAAEWRWDDSERSTGVSGDAPAQTAAGLRSTVGGGRVGRGWCIWPDGPWRLGGWVGGWGFSHAVWAEAVGGEQALEALRRYVLGPAPAVTRGNSRYKGVTTGRYRSL
jgi:hypothetical protein